VLGGGGGAAGVAVVAVAIPVAVGAALLDRRREVDDDADGLAADGLDALDRVAELVAGGLAVAYETRAPSAWAGGARRR